MKDHDAQNQIVVLKYKIDGLEREIKRKNNNEITSALNGLAKILGYRRGVKVYHPEWFKYEDTTRSEPDWVKIVTCKTCKHEK